MVMSVGYSHLYINMHELADIVTLYGRNRCSNTAISISNRVLLSPSEMMASFSINTIQKQKLFYKANGNCWKRIAPYVGVDETRLPRAMMCKMQFNHLVKDLVK